MFSEGDLFSVISGRPEMTFLLYARHELILMGASP